MKTTDQLLDAAREIWAQYDTHPFVLGIRNGDLPREKFRFYMIQDYLYLRDYARVFALGVAKAKSPKLTALFSGYVNMLTGSEMDIHRGYLGQFGVTREEIDTARVSLASLSYTSYMLRVAYEEDEAAILAAVLACALSYQVIAAHMVEKKPDCVEDPFYGEWVRGYLGEAYLEENRVLVSAFDEITQNLSPEKRGHLVNIFTACSRYELGFWEMAWNMEF